MQAGIREMRGAIHSRRQSDRHLLNANKRDPTREVSRTSLVEVKDLKQVGLIALAVLRFRSFDSVLRPLGFARDRILSNVEGFDSPKIGASASATLRRTGAQDFAQDGYNTHKVLPF